MSRSQKGAIMTPSWGSRIANGGASPNRSRFLKSEEMARTRNWPRGWRAWRAALGASAARVARQIVPTAAMPRQVASPVATPKPGGYGDRHDQRNPQRHVDDVSSAAEVTAQRPVEVVSAGECIAHVQDIRR